MHHHAQAPPLFLNDNFDHFFEGPSLPFPGFLIHHPTVFCFKGVYTQAPQSFTLMSLSLWQILFPGLLGTFKVESIEAAAVRLSV